MTDSEGSKILMAMIAELAALKGKEVGKHILIAYDRALRPYGYERVLAAMQKILEQLDINAPFPSIKQIKQILDPKASPEDEAIEAANRVIAAVSIYGPYRQADFKAYVGELGWRLVELTGGVSTLCEIEMSEIPATRAQLTKLAMTQLNRASAGLDGIAPTLARQDEAPGLTNLAGIMGRITDRSNQ